MSYAAVVLQSNRELIAECGICLTEMACLESSICGHSACMECLRQWLEQLEANGQEATCFQCRQALPIDDIRRILKRDMRLRRREPETIVDPLTLDWMQANNIMKCPWCGIWIEKVGGCNNVHCWCDKEFCFQCGARYCKCDGDEYYADDLDVYMEAMARLIAELEEGFQEDRMIGFDAEFMWQGCKSELIERRRREKKKKRSARMAQADRRPTTTESRRKNPKDTIRSRRRRSPRKEGRWVVACCRI